MTTIHRGKYTDDDIKDKIWNKAKTIKEKDKKMYRKDVYGIECKYDAFGKTVEGGWQIDHIVPVSKGGSDDISNLQMLNIATNETKGGTLKKKSRHSIRNK
jgi:5-methylcytosine-specific restriction endonuclease McrA